MTRWLTALAAVAAITTLWAQPQPPNGGDGPRRGGAMLGNADTNGDGKVDAIEAQQAAKQRLDLIRTQMDQARQQFDADGDGTLNPQEQAALKNKLAERTTAAAGGAGGGRSLAIVGMVDKDGDWKLSPEEEKAALEMITQRVLQGDAGGGAMPRPLPPPDPDTNGDCIIDDTEARLAAEKRVDFGRKAIDRLRERAKDNPEAPYPPLAAELDSDRNYDVSDAEAQAAVERTMADLQKRNAIVLKYFDTDKDGKLSAAETPAAKAAFAFMNEVRPERPEMGDRQGPMQPRDRPGQGGRPGEGREPRRAPQPGRGDEPRPPQPPAEKAP
jgi:hypothetical protein